MSSADRTLLVGTTKGAFVLCAAGDRRDWSVEGPFCDGTTVNHFAHDPKSGTIWAGGGGEWPGAQIWRSEDGGATWERRNRLANAAACEGHAHPAAPSGGETGHCVHNMMRAPGDGDVLY